MDFREEFKEHFNINNSNNSNYSNIQEIITQKDNVNNNINNEYSEKQLESIQELRQLGFVVNDDSNSKDINTKKLNEILKEIDSIKHLMIDLNTVVQSQGENINIINESIHEQKEITFNTYKELQSIKDMNDNKGKLYYLQNYVIPAIGMLGLNIPLTAVFGVKTAVIMSSGVYSFYKLKFW